MTALFERADSVSRRRRYRDSRQIIAMAAEEATSSASKSSDAIKEESAAVSLNSLIVIASADNKFSILPSA